MVYRVANFLGGLMFGYAAAVQLNDPDPIPWIVAYGTAALVCAVAALGRLPWTIPASLAVVTGLVGLAWSQVTPQGAMGGFPTWAPLQEETVREMLGLGLVSGWMGGLAWFTARRAPAR